MQTASKRVMRKSPWRTSRNASPSSCCSEPFLLGWAALVPVPFHIHSTVREWSEYWPGMLTEYPGPSCTLAFIRSGHRPIPIAKSSTYMYLGWAALYVLIPPVHLLAKHVRDPAQSSAGICLPRCCGQDSCSRVSLWKAVTSLHLYCRFVLTQYVSAFLVC